MTKQMTQKQEALMKAVVDGALEMISDNGELNADQAQEALNYLIARFNKVRPVDLMPEQE